ncbi:hypothetical protein FRC14_005519 [Serendipita sp. 396]|nr:hypothetical protein FRC14_005519 [Serendipita sp. 396]KAG8775474.1 hypothetical protein FRC15_000511 [Serendipita sp. 397]KAG8865485.1 hypothetical protein FRC20_009777 [Serendipita sp. 405]
MAYRVDKPYERNEAIILAFDIGTTHTAVSFSHAIPGEHPDVRSVIKWPGQPEASGDSKIPTIIAYQDGEAKYFGAEAREFLEDEDYEIARWFKPRLHPASMKLDRAGNGSDSSEYPPLPRGVSLVEVYSDFIRYIYGVTKNFFINNTPNGQQTWSRLHDQMPIVFCTPNGWDLCQHAVLTDASIRAGIAAEVDAEDCLWFLTEGEASVHYALAHNKTVDWLNQGTIFAVTDVGGSTVDSTLYHCQSRSPLVLEEVCASACVQAGGIFVDQTIREILERKLNGSEYSDHESISLMVRQFEQKTKRAFDGSQATNVIQFGSSKDNDKVYDIVKGKLTLSCEEIEEAYVSVIFSIVDSCNTLLANHMVQYLILVGGFGESPYLRGQLKCILGGKGTEVVTVEEPSKKAAADGAVIWYLTELVEGRATRFDYGIIHATRYNPSLHEKYKDISFTNADGGKYISTFKVLIPKDTILNAQWKILVHKTRVLLDPSDPSFDGEIVAHILSWRGKSPAPHILDLSQFQSWELPPGLAETIQIRANLGAILNPAKTSLNQTTGKPYCDANISYEFSLKGMKLRARIHWTEKVLMRPSMTN